jgi:glycine cleavage system H protein
LIQDFKLHIPSGVLISRGHVWIRNLSDNKIQIGLDDFCPGLLTKVDSIKLRKTGDRVNDDEGMCVLYQGEKKLSFFSPFDGIIQEVNPLLLENPKILCLDPFNKGWIYKISPSFDPSYIFESDLLFSHAFKWQKKEKERLAHFLQEDPSFQKKLEPQLKEGKLSLKGLLDNLDKLAWLKFEENFLK